MAVLAIPPFYSGDFPGKSASLSRGEGERRYAFPMFDFTYAQCVEASEQVAWRLDEVFPADTAVEFTRPFLPRHMVGAQLELEDPEQALAANHVSAHAYLNLFSFVEEYIIGVAVQHAQAELYGEPSAMRALCRMADEEVKHQQLFARYSSAFRRDYQSPCLVLEQAATVASAILSKSPIAVMLVTLHLELATQDHFVRAVRDNAALDPTFVRMLKAHWLEEAQHSKIDALELEKLVAGSPEAARKAAGADYVAILGELANLLYQQAEMDLESVAAKVGSALDRDKLLARQYATYQRLFIRAGIEHKTQRSAITWACGDLQPLEEVRAYASAC